ncbi:MAG: hypothetical protein CMA63_08000 [Euryarchaeota archaeon]|nr:hypothetical protein [Euryarchaeota archaeon]|tara:strand:+ start:13090 stop:13662 length:573 start_codon:yes stop_codon:yes gene_type:complete
MISAATFHVITTELVVGSFALAGISFVLCLLLNLQILSKQSLRPAADSVAHAALLFGLLATPFAVVSGISSVPGGGLSSPILVNKMLMSMTGFGFALSALLCRWRMGDSVWNTPSSTWVQAISGGAASTAMLLTASAGGTFTRGESLLDILHLPYEHVLLFPVPLSGVYLLAGILLLVMGWKKSSSSIEH